MTQSEIVSRESEGRSTDLSRTLLLLPRHGSRLAKSSSSNQSSSHWSAHILTVPIVGLRLCDITRPLGFSRLELAETKVASHAKLRQVMARSRHSQRLSGSIGHRINYDLIIDAIGDQRVRDLTIRTKMVDGRWTTGGAGMPTAVLQSRPRVGVTEEALRRLVYQHTYWRFHSWLRLMIDSAGNI